MNIHTNVKTTNAASTSASRLNTRSHRKFFSTAAFSLAAAFTLSACAAQTADIPRVSTPKHFGAGIDINSQPRVEETGLPLYPGATIDRTDSAEREDRGERAGKRAGKQKNSDEEGVNLNLWFGSYGLKLVVVKLKTNDSVEQVGAFYRDALSKYGAILDCSDAGSSLSDPKRKNASFGVEVWSDTDNNSDPSSTESRRANSNQKSTQLSCKDGQIHSTSIRRGKFYKTGTKQKQYGVAVQSQGDGSTFQLFHFEKRGGED